jgi:hypothetical protein
MGMHVNDRCINCGHAVAGANQKYCPNCGQPTPAHRIDWHFLGHELEHSVLHMDRGILYSLKQVMGRPGALLRDYIDGKRGNQVKPLLLITMMSAVVLLLNRLITGTSIVDGGATDAILAGQTLPAEMQRFMLASRAVASWIESHFAAFTLMLLPIEALVFRVVFSRYSKLNYPEWLVIITLLTVQTFVIWSVLVLLHRWVSHTQVLAGMLGMIYIVVSLVQFFQQRSTWSTVWRSVLALGVFSVLSSVVVFVGTLAVMGLG